MRVFSDVAALRDALAEHRRQGHVISLVPTMGNLHEGHHSLIDLAREHADVVVASVFVNPTQFGPNEDFSRYPRTPEQDIAGLEQKGCDVVFVPDVATMYPFDPEHGVRVSVADLAGVLEGAVRPGHFDGVATVVAKLFNFVQPDVAIFGRKDFQQLLVVQTMVRDLCFPVRIVGASIVREANGLAMSSRNQYLDDAQREQAGVIHSVLRDLADQVRTGDVALAAIEIAASDHLRHAGLQPDYVTLRRSDDLGDPYPDQRSGLVALVAARLGGVRLLDNIEIDLA